MKKNEKDSIKTEHLIKILTKDPTRLEDYGIKYESERNKEKKDGAWQWLKKYQKFGF